MTHQGDILIVDDQPDNIRFLSSMLIEQGYNVRKAISGKMALIAIETLPPDLVLLDITMPDMTGYAVCEKIKADPKIQQIPIIFLSALDNAIDKVKAFEIGGADYITKPFQFAEVLARIDNQLAVRRLQKKLENQNETLQNTLNDLQKTQTQLIQQERMAGLGQLVSGLAHEINNPISFIYGNLTPASEYVKDLLDLFDLYQQEYPDPKPSIQEMIEELDLEFLKSDLHNLLNSMQHGAERIRNIIEGLKHFSCIDEEGKKVADLHAGLDSTILMLDQRLQATPDRLNIQINKQYGQIPKIFCYPGQLNQVFFNLLLNAIEAIDQKNEPSYDPQILIQTEMIESDHILIIIQDNGVGISPKIQPKIFNPFFTTKTVGKGTGLGLAISYQIIVEQHHGTIDVESSDQGTMVKLELPIHVDG